MVDTNLSALKKAKTDLLLKPLDAAIFLAPHYTAHPTAFTSATSKLQTLPTAYEAVGLISKNDGVSFARSVESSTMESFGELEATRQDITGGNQSLSFMPQETNRLTLELTTGADLKLLKANKDSGEVFFAQPTNAKVTYYSAIVIGQDGDDDEPIYLFKVLPKVAVSNYDGETWSKESSAAQRLTMTAFKDATAGFAVAHGYGGAGWKKLLTQVGIPLATV
ncbi:phage tail tube protein [Rhodococcus sp. NPDC003994]